MAGIKLKSLEVQIRTITLKFVTVGKVIYWFIAIALDLFRLSILFSQYRSYDDTPESFFFQSWAGIFMLTSSLFDEHDKGSNLLGIVKWSVLEKKLTWQIFY